MPQPVVCSSFPLAAAVTAFALMVAFVVCAHPAFAGSRSTTRTAQRSSTIVLRPVYAPYRLQYRPRTVRAISRFPEEVPAGEARRQRIVEDVRRSGVVAGCWASALAWMPIHPAEHVHVRLEVGAEGRGIVSVGETIDPRLSRCVRGRLASVRFVGGEPVTVDADYVLSR